MASDYVIRVENLAKRYRIGLKDEISDTLVGAITSFIRRPLKNLKNLSRLTQFHEEEAKDIIWALRDVSFDVAQGEVVGIIGRNGAGKSTLLKVLSRITEPTSGQVRIRGRVSSLLEVGTGFHPELTGRENIYLNGTILGMRKAEIDRKFAEIVDFSGVEKFLDTPVKRYSSGMYVRLAFAVAAHLEPEILIVDEVLAVGDIAFQEKCLGKMGDIAQSGRTVLFVSHNLAAVTSLCSRLCLLENGLMTASGLPQSVIEKYLNQLQSVSGTNISERTDRHGDGKLRMTRITFKDTAELPIEAAMSGQDIIIELIYTSENETNLKNVSFSLGIYSALGQFLVFCGNEMIGVSFKQLASNGKIVCRIPRLPLTPGRYVLNLYCEVNGVLADWVQQAYFFSVAAGDFFGTGSLAPASHGGVLVPHSWDYEEIK